MNEWNGAMEKIYYQDEHRSAQRKSSSTVTMSTTNPTQTGLGLIT